MGRSRDCEPKISRGAELEWQAAQAHCKLSNRYASPTWGSRWSFSCSCSWRWRWRKSSALAALRFIVKYWNYTSCEPLELGQWENELCASCICILCRKKPSQLVEQKKKGDQKQVPLRLSPWQLSISARKSAVNEKVFSILPIASRRRL